MYIYANNKLVVEGITRFDKLKGDVSIKPLSRGEGGKGGKKDEVNVVVGYVARFRFARIAFRAAKRKREERERAGEERSERANENELRRES